MTNENTENKKIKPLTDDQINQLFDIVWKNLGKDENLYIKFARALEELHNIR